MRGGKEQIYEEKRAVRAERTVIGTRRLSCVASFEGRFVVEHEAMMINKGHVTAGAPMRPFRAWLRSLHRAGGLSNSSRRDGGPRPGGVLDAIVER